MFSRAIRLTFVVLLATLTIAWKATIVPENSNYLSEALVEFLGKQQFETFVTDRVLDDTKIVEATSDKCHLWAGRVSPLGYEADLVRRISDRSGRVLFVFQGHTYAEQPVRLTVASFLWFRLLRELGFVRRVPPVIAVVSTCDVAQLPWNQVLW